MGLRQPVHRHHDQVRREGRRGHVRQSVHHQPVVDLVGEDDQAVLAGHLEHVVEHLCVVERAGGVVRVDDDHRAGARGDLAAQIVHVRVPVGGLVAAVIHGRRAAQADGVAPERVIRRRDEHLVARIEQRHQGEIDHLAHAVADEHVLRIDVLDALAQSIVHNGLPGGGHALKVAVGNALFGAPFQRGADAFGQREAEGRRVAGVELHDRNALLLHAQGLAIERAADVGMHASHALCQMNHM